MTPRYVLSTQQCFTIVHFSTPNPLLTIGKKSLEEWKIEKIDGLFPPAFQLSNLLTFQPSFPPFCFVCANKLTVLKFSLPTAKCKVTGDASFGRFASFNFIGAAAAGRIDFDRAAAHFGRPARTPARRADYAGCRANSGQTDRRFARRFAAVDFGLGRAGLAGGRCLDPGADRRPAACSPYGDALISTAFSHFFSRAVPVCRYGNNSYDSCGCPNPKTDHPTC
jgi:hypothetical protein